MTSAPTISALARVADATVEQRVLDGESLGAVLGQFPCSIAVITTEHDGPVGCTVTSLIPVSLDPPLVAFSLSQTSRSGRAWCRATHGTVHLLHAEQVNLAARFSRRGLRDRFAGVAWHPDPDGTPILDDALAWLRVTPCRTLCAADHLVVIARVVTVAVGRGRPLLHADGRYGVFTSLHNP